MKVVHPDILLPLVKGDALINETVIENESVFSSLVLDLYKQSVGASGNVIFSDDGKTCTAKSICLIGTPTDIDLNTRTVLNKIYKHIEMDVSVDNLPDNYYHALQYLHDTISALTQGYYLNSTALNNITLTQVLSLFQVQYPAETMTFNEQLLDYLDIYRSLYNIKLFVFVQMRAYLTPENYEALLRFIRYERLQAWFIEASEKTPPQKRNDYHKVIIDKDLCEI